VPGVPAKQKLNEVNNRQWVARRLAIDMGDLEGKI
jgi:hypothetical protein